MNMNCRSHSWDKEKHPHQRHGGLSPSQKINEKGRQRCTDFVNYYILRMVHAI